MHRCAAVLLSVLAGGALVGVDAQAPPSAPTNVYISADVILPPPGSPPLGDWPTAGGNLQRTSSSSADISTVDEIAWYRPIEAFISGSTQIIAARGRAYIATARGLVVLNADTGALICRFDTELPVGTPTVVGGSVYVPGFDRSLYSLNSATCAVNWEFTGAGAGFSANALVTGGRVYIGNRDGTFYALHASDGSEAWSYATGGPIMQSAAYDDGILYVASMDMYGYALQSATGALVWKTPQKLPGQLYSAWWPVIHGDYVIWSGATAYKYEASPGALDVGPAGVDFNAFFGVPVGTLTAGTVIASSDGSHGWPAGSAVISTVAGSGPNTLQGWADAFPARRVYAIVNKSDGAEPFYLPMLEAGQNNEGQMHPPVSDGQDLYFNGPYLRDGPNIPRSRAMTWREDTPWLRMISNITYAADEPLILSLAGGRLLVNLCCDREARVLAPTTTTFWHYTEMLDDVLPSQGASDSYDVMWAFYDGANFLERLGGYYRGTTTSRNGVYHVHGMQNPLVPHAFMNASAQRVERVFTHRSNAIIALGPTATHTPLPLVTINPTPPNEGRSLTGLELAQRLETEIQKMVDLYLASGTAGFLRPAYVSDGVELSNTTIMPERDTYFRVPADTLYTLARAYPHLSAGLQTQLLAYLDAFWQKYFVTAMVRVIGWNAGAPREAMTYPPEVANRMTEIGDVSAGPMPQRIFAAAFRYAQLVPAQAATIYNTVRPLLSYPPPGTLDIVRGPAIYNDYIVGYQGFMDLYDLAGTNPDAVLRAGVATQLANLLTTRLTNFAKDHPWDGAVDNPTGINVNNYARRYNCARNFLYMTSDLGAAMNGSAQAALIDQAIDEYAYLCPHWFMARDDATFQEGSAHHIFDSHALFLARAYVSLEPRSELSKWIDVPWMLGDLYYLQNLTAALEADE